MYGKTRYRMVSRTHHGLNPRSEHRLLVESVIGETLPRHAIIHHVNGDGRDNQPANLVVCESMSYHRALHRRERALAATGNPDARFCRFCKTWDDPANLYVGPYFMTFHRACRNASLSREV